MASQQLGANFFISYLSSSLAASGSETTINLSTITTLTGETITTNDVAFFGRGTITIDPLSSVNIESATFTGVDGTNIALTGTVRGLSALGNDSSTSRALYHPVGTLVIISFGVHTLADIKATFAQLTAVQTVSGAWTFTASPVVPTGATGNQAIGYAQANAILTGSVGSANSTTPGTTKLSYDPYKTLGTCTITIATPAVISLTAHGLIANDTVKFTTTGALPTGLTVGTTYYVISAGLTANAFEVSTSQGGTAVNTTGTQSGVHTCNEYTPFAVNQNDPMFVNYFADTGAANAYVITPNPAIAAYAVGQRFSFKATNANTTTSTLNVNALGAKTIVKGNAANVAANDILSGQIVMVEYDGTNFQMLSQIGNTPSAVIPSQASQANKLLSTDGTNLKWIQNPKVYVETAGASFSNTLTETTISTFTLLANNLSTNNGVNIKIPFSVLVWGLTGKTIIFRLKYGGTTVVTLTITDTSGSPSSTYTGFVEAYIIASGATNSQLGVINITGGTLTATSGANDGPVVTGLASGTAAVDSTANQTLTITGQFNDTTATTTFSSLATIVSLIS